MASGGLYLGSVSLKGGVGSNIPVNINASNGDALTNTMGALNVSVSNPVGSEVPVSDTVLDACVADNQVGVNVKTTVSVPIQAYVDGTPTDLNGLLINGDYCLRTFQSALGQQNAIWCNGAFTASTGGGLGKAYPLASISVGYTGLKQVSLFGNVSALDGANPLNLTIVYSQDNSTWVDSSLGAINFTSVGDFSRDWTTSAPYISIYADTPATATIWYGVSM